MTLKNYKKLLVNYTWTEVIEKYYKLVEVLMVNRLLDKKNDKNSMEKK